MIYTFWLHPWYLLAIVLSFLLWFTDSDYTLGIFWPLRCLFFYDIQILIAPLVSFGHCVVCSSMIYRFWLHPWYLLAIVLSVLLWYTDSDYPLVSFGHCVVCSSMIYRFWLPPWYILAIVLSVLLWYTDSDYPLGIIWSLCCVFFYEIPILIIPLVSFDHCVVCSYMIYRFWLHPWYILAIVLSVLLWYTDFDYPLGIFWPLCCLFFYDKKTLITPWYLLAIVLSVLLWHTDSDYTLGIFWPLCCLFFYDLQVLITPMVSFGHLFFYDIQILITPLVSFGHCVVYSSMIYRFWLHPWYLLAIVFSVLLWYTDSDYPLGIFWPLCCLFLYDIQILITPLVSFGHCGVCSSMIYGFWLPLVSVGHCVVCSSMIYRFWLPLGIFWPLCCLFFYDIQILITPLVSFGHSVVCSSMIYRFWLHPWYLLAICSSMIYRFWLHPWYLSAIVLSVLLWFRDSDYPLGIFWPLCCLFFYGLRFLITPLVSFGHLFFYNIQILITSLVSSGHLFFYDIQILITPWYLLAILLSVLLWYTDSEYPLGIFWPLCCLFFYDIQILITPLVSFGHCVVCSSMIYRFSLPPWYLLAIVLSDLLWYTDSDYPLVSFGHCVVCSSMTYRFWLPLGIFWPLCCLIFYDIQIVITPLVSFRNCVVSSSMIYRFWLPLGIVWPLCCLFFYDLQILITPLVSFGHCVVCSSIIYRFWLFPWYLLGIVFSVLLWYTDSDYTLVFFCPLCCLFFYDIQILITPWYLLAIVLSVLLWYTDSDYTLGIFGHCGVWSSMIYRFWLPPWYLLAIVLSDLLLFTDSDYTLGIFWQLCCLFSYELWILITPLVSFGHCVFCSSMIYRFWLHPCFLLSIVLSVLLWYTDSDYPLVSFGHCVVCSSMIYRFSLHPWYLLAIVLSVLLWYTDSHYPLGIFWPLCCLIFYDIQILITPWYLLAIVLSVLLWHTDSDYPLVSFGHCVVWSSMIYRLWLPPWYLLAIVLSVELWILITPLVSFGHCVFCSSMIYRFWLHPCYLLAMVFLFFYDIQIMITPLVSFSHCVVCSSMTYRFWLYTWYHLTTVLSVLTWHTDSDYTLGIFWPLFCLFFYDIQILITPLVSFGHCVVCSSMIYIFWLHLGIFWPLCCLFFYDIQILITHLVSFGHCVVCSSIIYRFWLHPWYLLAIVLSVLLWYTDFDYPLGIFWPLCFLFFYGIQILITPLVSFGHCVVCSSMIYRFWLSLLVSFGHCVVCSSMIYRNLITPLLSVGHCVVCSSMIYRFWLHPWHLLAIVLSVLLWYTDSDYTLGIFWPLFCLFFYDLGMVITPWYLLAIVLSLLLWVIGFWLHPWYLLAIVFSVLLWYTDSDYTLVIFWPWRFLFFYDIQIMITPLVSFSHCVVCSSMTYRFWLYTWYHLTTVLSVLTGHTDSDYTLGIFWPLFCLFFYDIQILITPLVSFGHCVVCSSMIYIFWLHLGIFWPLCCLFFYDIQILDYTLGIFWPLCCLFFYNIQILITPLVSFGHCVVCSSMIYRFWLPPWYLLVIVLSVLWYIEFWLHLCYLLAIVLSVLLWYTDSDYNLGIFWSLCCLFFYDIQILITPLVSVGNCVVCSSMIYRFWLPPWYLLAIVLSVSLWYTDSDYTLGIFRPLCCLFFYDLRILISSLVSFGNCVFCSSMIDGFWLSLGIFWTLCCLFFYDLHILITPLVSFGHCVVFSSMIYRFWLHPWYLLAILLSVLLWYTDSDYTLGIFWPLCCLFFYNIQILITPLVSFGHCVFCSSMIYRFWLPSWYLSAIVLSVLLWLTNSDYLPWYLLAILLSVLLWFTDSDYPLVSFGHCVVCSSMIYRFWLPPWYLLTIVLSVHLWYTDSDYTLGIFWPLCCLFFYAIQILIIPLVSFGNCVVCSSMIYGFWLSLGIFWPLCCLFFYDIQILITPLASFGHCVVCSSMIYRFWIPLGIFWPLCCLFYDI